MKKLYRSDTNKIVGGVLGGLGEYFDIDPVVVRLVFVALFILTGILPGFLIYVIALLIVPRPVVRIIDFEGEDGH